jgi:flavin-dependent dehydrogenase
MIAAEVIVVGGGPAGSTCARELKRCGIDTLILDKSDFPRDKLCAGWITPRVVEMLELAEYPHSLTYFDRLRFHFFGRPVSVRTRQYAVRRAELDHWLLHRAGVPVVRHTVRRIERSRGGYVIDNSFRCTYLVGAGGTYCPVKRAFFGDSFARTRESMIVTLEEEFAYDYRDGGCNLWFFERKLSGYAWYVPKAGGFLNIGIGGKLAVLKSRKTSILQHWNFFTGKLQRLGLVRNHSFHPRGYVYTLRWKRRRVRLDNVFLVGDAAGLATRDMGEGIAPAVESGLRAAAAIARGRAYSIDSIPSYSLPAILAPRLYRRRGRSFPKGAPGRFLG